MTIDSLLSTTQVKAITGTHDPTLWRWIHSGWLRPARQPNGSGTRTGWSQSDVLQCAVLASLRHHNDNGRTMRASRAVGEWFRIGAARAVCSLATADALIIAGDVVTPWWTWDGPERLMRPCVVLPLHQIRRAVAEQVAVL